MAITFISQMACSNNLRSYADKKVTVWNPSYSWWNPFSWFIEKNLANDTVARRLAGILANGEAPSDENLLEIAEAIDSFEDFELQKDLLCFLNTEIIGTSSSFLAKKNNVEELKNILNSLVNKLVNTEDRPWWAVLFSADLRWFIAKIDNLFKARREEIKNHLIDVYSNDEIAKQIISEYISKRASYTGKQNKVNDVLNTLLDKADQQTQRELIRNIIGLVKDLPCGEALISVAGLSYIITSYLSKEENKAKSIGQQAQDIAHIIVNAAAAQVVQSAVGVPLDVAKAVVSFATSESAANPLDTDRRMGGAFAGVVGSAVGGAIGSPLPVIGTAIGASFGAVVSKTAATQFYQVLEAWQRAPKGPRSIIPGYTQSPLASIPIVSSFYVDNDSENILKPLYERYMKTERESKRLGEEIAKWLSICDRLLQNPGEPISDEYLEIIHEEMTKLRSEFTALKDTHALEAEGLYRKERDNKPRLILYLHGNEDTPGLKASLARLHDPIDGMLNKYNEYASSITAASSGNLTQQLSNGLATPTTVSDSHTRMRLVGLSSVPAPMSLPPIMVSAAAAASSSSGLAFSGRQLSDNDDKPGIVSLHESLCHLAKNNAHKNTSLKMA